MTCTAKMALCLNNTFYILFLSGIYFKVWRMPIFLRTFNFLPIQNYVVEFEFTDSHSIFYWIMSIICLLDLPKLLSFNICRQTTVTEL